MTRTVTLVGYGVIAVAAVALEVAARRSHRFATAGGALGTLIRWWPARVGLQAIWLWLGWHLFVRVDW